MAIWRVPGDGGALGRALKTSLLFGLLFGGGIAAAVADDAAPIVAQVSDPRAFGHLVGDVLTRTIVLDVPNRLKLDDASVPTAGRIGHSFELRRVAQSWLPTLTGRRYTLALDYQVFRAPSEPVVLDLPSFTLRFDGQPRGEELRIDFAPVGITPLAPLEAPLRAGLGSLRPDTPPLQVDTRPEQWRLGLYAVLALLPLAHLAMVYLGWPWWRRRQRPFARARRHLQGVSVAGPPGEWLDAWRALHAALDATASRVLHAGAVDRFVAERPAYAAVRGEMLQFFERSERFFFGGQTPLEADRLWLRDFCRRCFDIERGLA
jgi:mxaA protein